MTSHPRSLDHRRRRIAVGSLAAVLAWAAIASLPTSAAAVKAGEMHTEIITLTGASGQDAFASTSGGLSSKTTQSAPSSASPGWSAAIDVENGTQAVAASWLGAEHGSVEVRGMAADQWSEWSEIEGHSDEAPDSNQRNSGSMVWFGRDGVDLVEIRVTSGTLIDLELQQMRYEDPQVTSSLFTTSTAGAAASQPAIQPRTAYTSKGWVSSNPTCSTGPSQAAGGVTFAVVHHTVHSNTYAQADVPAMLAATYAYHTGTNKWCDIGYNFIVDRFGTIWEGRSGGIDKAIVGGHAQGFNSGSVGVSFLGQHEPGASPAAAQPSNAALNAAGKLIGWKLGLKGIDPLGTTSYTTAGSNKHKANSTLTINRVIGHRDAAYTACPGTLLYDSLGTIRQVAKTAQGQGSPTTTTTKPPTTTTTKPPVTGPYAPFVSAAQLIQQQYRDVLQREPSSADQEFWGSRVAASWTPGQFIAHLALSSEADTKVHSLTRLYLAYFLRNPDHGGHSYWLAQRNNGATLVSISTSFANSSEFKNRYGSLSNSAFVDRVYRNVMGRSADTAGLNYWTGRLNSGTSRGQVMANFSQSSEYISKTNDKVRVIGTYEAMLKRAVDQNAFTVLVNALEDQTQNLSAITSSVFASNEYRNRFS